MHVRTCTDMSSHAGSRTCPCAEGHSRFRVLAISTLSNSTAQRLCSVSTCHQGSTVRLYVRAHVGASYAFFVPSYVQGVGAFRSRRRFPGAGCRNLERVGHAIIRVGTAVSCGTRDSKTPSLSTFASRGAAQIHARAAQCEPRDA
eukprot:351058-Chlamydomonas_euryale.AAC.3